jgi:hypothetical protein
MYADSMYVTIMQKITDVAVTANHTGQEGITFAFS